MRLARLLAFLTLLVALAAPALAADVANGQSIVRNTCAACHGFPPVGGPERAAGNPALITAAISANVPAMFFLRSVLTPTDIDDVAAYLAVLFAGPGNPPPPPTEKDSYQGLWLNFPFESESGWGINFVHQGDILFATWFTYDVDGSGMWLVMSEGRNNGSNRFTGDLYRTQAPGPFSSSPFQPVPSPAGYTKVGTLSVFFLSPGRADMTYTVNNVTQNKNLARYTFVATPPTCKVGGTAGSTPNYDDLWWVPSESGWGLNIVHQGDIFFGTWFTYGPGGKGMWMVIEARRVGTSNVYTGIVQRTTGPPFSAVPFNPNLVVRTTVGDVTLTFTDNNHATFRYTVDNITQTKTIERLGLTSPVTVCK